MQRKENLTAKYILFFLIAIFIGIGLASLVYYTHQRTLPLEKKIIYTDVTVIEEKLVGFNVNITALNFGRMPKGSYAKKWIMLQNNYPHPVKVVTYVSGNISPFISSSNYTMILPPNYAANISVSVLAKTETTGHYEGYLEYVFLRT